MSILPTNNLDNSTNPANVKQLGIFCTPCSNYKTSDAFPRHVKPACHHLKKRGFICVYAEFAYHKAVEAYELLSERHTIAGDPAFAAALAKVNLWLDIMLEQRPEVQHYRVEENIA
ncbi:hypothetical protein J4E83_005324 [Alternaria metachromatica]|uniref:uncharacterized protein n=1 Tax=Alternaria metachromatica TaxID=283354 RepID=UPI0020C33A19|nr:uncharacterized protein J4E83_005324 [Alternaria metachromatica]KAI4620961.1 hypothetical protein J4E83_005324 [Alternaria metachromatica]